MAGESSPIAYRFVVRVGTRTAPPHAPGDVAIKVPEGVRGWVEVVPEQLEYASEGSPPRRVWFNQLAELPAILAMLMAPNKRETDRCRVNND